MQFADLLTRVGYLPPKDIEVLSRAYDAAARVRRVLVAVGVGVAVWRAKLDGRLDGVSAVAGLPEVRRRAMAQATGAMYARLAHRLGVWNIKWALEALSVAQLHPGEYR